MGHVTPIWELRSARQRRNVYKRELVLAEHFASRSGPLLPCLPSARERNLLVPGEQCRCAFPTDSAAFHREPPIFADLFHGKGAPANAATPASGGKRCPSGHVLRFTSSSHQLTVTLWTLSLNHRPSHSLRPPAPSRSQWPFGWME